VTIAGLFFQNKSPGKRLQQQYSALFADSDTGNPAKSARVALGALIVKERLGVTDRETVEQIRENPYLQYFLGLAEYKYEEPFHHSLMTHFRKRFDKDTLARINESIVFNARDKEKKDDPQEDSSNDTPTANRGKLIVDATCTPADITYPTDLKLLNEAREKTEEIIDRMHESLVGLKNKPRTYRQKAHKDYLAVARQKKPGSKKIRKAIRKQLGYLKRNLHNIDIMALEGLSKHLNKRLYRLVLVIKELYWSNRNRCKGKMNWIGLPLKASLVKASVASAWIVSWPNWLKHQKP